MTLTLRSRMVARAAAAGLAAAALIAPLAACSSSSSSDSASTSGGVVELTYQSWVPNIDKAVDAFNASHSDVHVTFQSMAAGPDGGYAKLLSAVSAGSPPDVAQVGYDSLPDFMLAGALENITPYVGDKASTFTDWQWQQGVFNNDVYAIPQASGPVGQFYRKDLFAKLGLSAPTTWEEYYEDAKKIHQANPKAYIAAFAYNQSPWLIALAQQAGAHWFTVDGDSWKVSLTDSSTQQMAAFWQKLIDEGLVKIEPDMSNEWYADLQAGTIYSWMSGSWAGAIIEGNAPKTSGDWAAAEMPQWTQGSHVSASWGGGSANVVLKGSKHAKAAAEFAVWLNSDAASVSILNSVGAGYPAVADKSGVTSLTEDTKTEKFFGGQNINDVFSVADKNVDTSWKWPPLVSALYSSLADNVKAAVSAKTPVIDAISKTQDDMISAMKAKGISVSN